MAGGPQDPITAPLCPRLPGAFLRSQRSHRGGVRGRGVQEGPPGGEARKGAEGRRTAPPLGLWVVGASCPGAAGERALAPDAPQGLVSPRPRGPASVSSLDP